MNWIKSKWNQIEAEPKTVRKFGFILAGILFVLGAIALFRGHQQYWIEWPLGVIIWALALAAGAPLKYLYRAWMLAAEGISWVLLRLILGIFYYFILSPVGLMMRVFRKDLLDQKIERRAPSYWKKRTGPSAREQYERLF
ncbi:MAG: hypothetical protein HY588_00450 [Candidatus Omnitrophica bacterium]|nr:hypothetical protein [Candidatus Omnitrophota bacterium]